MSPEEFEGYQAAAVVARQATYTHMSNFNHHLHRAEIERLPETMRARRLFFRALRETLASNFDPALQIYRDDDAIKAWLEKVLLPHPVYRKDDLIQEQTIEFALGYLAVLNERYGRETCDWAYRLRMIGPFPDQSGLGDAGRTAPLYWFMPQKAIAYKGRWRVLTSTPFDIRIPNEQDLPPMVLTAVGLGPAGPLLVSSVIEATRTEPLLDPAIVRRIMIEKELIPADPKPAPMPMSGPEAQRPQPRPTQPPR